MKLKIVTAPTSFPVTVADVEAHSNLGTIQSDQVGEVLRLIEAATKACEEHNRRQYITATWTAYFDDWPTQFEIRDKLPINSISSVKYDDVDGTLTTWSSSNYVADTDSDNHPARIMPVEGVAYPTLDTDAFNAVQVTFVAGYGTAADVPATAKHAILILVDHWFNNREVAAPLTLSKVPIGFDACLSATDWGWYG